MNPLESWLAEVAAALDIDASTVQVTELLDVTRDVARGVARPAGPLTTFLIGVAVGQHGADPRHAISQVAALAAARARGRTSDSEGDAGGQ